MTKHFLRSGKLLMYTTEVNITNVNDIVTENPHSSLKKIVVEAFLSHGFIFINHLGIKVGSPKKFDFYLKNQRVNSNPIFKIRIVIGDETWV